MRSSHILRRMAGDPLHYRNGILLATGAFVFQDGGVWKILTQTELDHLRALAGDPRTLQSQPNRLHMHYAQTSGEVANFFFKGGIFGSRLTKPLQITDNDVHPVDTNRVWRHYSDNLVAMVRTTDLDVEGSAEDGYTIDMTLNGTVETFEFEAINPGSGDVNGDFSKVLDTYFGGIIGMDDYVYIGAPRPTDPQAVVGYIYDGTSLGPVGQPPQSFFDELFGQIMDNYQITNQLLVRAKPLCRFSPDAFLAAGVANVTGQGDFFFPDHEGFEWMLHYMRIPYTPLNPVPVPLLADDPNNGLTPSPHAVGMVSMIPQPVRLRCQINGSVNCVFGMNDQAFSNPVATSRTGLFQVAQLYANGVAILPGQPGVRPDPFVLRKRLNGPYEVWLANDPALPALSDPNYQRFSVKWSNGTYSRNNVQTVTVNHSLTGPERNAPYPFDQQPYAVGEAVRAAAPHGGTFFVATRAFNLQLEIEQGRAGLLGATHLSPSGLQQRQPRVAGPFVFLDDDWVTVDQGQTWFPFNHVWGAGYKSTGARSIEWRFGFKRSELDAAVPI